MELYPLSPTAIRALVEASAQRNIFHGAVRSTKTWTALIRWAEYVRSEAPPGLLLMAGRTSDTLRDNCLTELEKLVGPDAFQWNTEKGRLFGRDLVFRGGANVLAEQSVRGMTLAGAYLNESTLLHADFRKQVGLRCSVEGSKRFEETNPAGPNHDIKKDIDRAEAGDYSSDQLYVRHFKLSDNLSLSKDYLDMLELEYQGVWYERFVLGKWVNAEGVIYGFFSKKKHILKALPAQPDAIDIAVDYGASNATSAGFYASWNFPPKGTELLAVRFGGYYHSNRESMAAKIDVDYVNEILAALTAQLTSMSERTWLEHFRKDSIQKLPHDVGLMLRSSWRKVRYVIIDPSALNFKRVFRMRLEAFALEATVRNAKNAVLDGIMTQSRMLVNGQYKLLDVPSNKRCIDDYAAYSWNPKATERGEDEPDKTSDADHTKDDERYFCHTIYGKEVLS
jgi:PBSX family phage terminase large subunit